MEENKIPNDVIEFAKSVMDSEHEVLDFDGRNVEVKMNGEDYNIRTWDITKTSIRWTLFKTIWGTNGGHGEEIKSGTYKILN
jgi:hypothetical protein